MGGSQGVKTFAVSLYLVPTLPASKCRALTSESGESGESPTFGGGYMVSFTLLLCYSFTLKLPLLAQI